MILGFVIEVSVLNKDQWVPLGFLTQSDGQSSGWSRNKSDIGQIKIFASALEADKMIYDLAIADFFGSPDYRMVTIPLTLESSVKMVSQ